MPNQTTSGSIAVAVGNIPAQLDVGLYVAGGNAAGFQITVDHSCTTPMLSGPVLVSDLQGVRYELSSLDRDVTAVLLGASSLGCSIVSFTNNHDGTGFILVDFAASPAVRYLAVVAQDDVRNQSGQSNVLAIQSDADVEVGTTFRIRPQTRAYDDLLTELLLAMPDGDYRQIAQYVLPYTPRPVVFDLEVRRPGVPVALIVVGVGSRRLDPEPTELTIIPDSTRVTVRLPLVRGRNLVSASDGQNTDTIDVSATNYAGILSGYARELYRNVDSRLLALEQDLDSPLSTLVLQPYAPWLSLAPPVQSLQVLGAKMAVRAVLNETARRSGVRDALAGLIGTTPVFRARQNRVGGGASRARPRYTSYEHRGGSEAHVWLADRCASRRAAFEALLPNLPMRLLRVSDHEISVLDDANQIVTHRFAENGTCSVYDIVQQRSCLDAMSVSLLMQSTMRIAMCVAQYPLDMTANAQYPFVPVSGEAGVTGLDPGWDAHAGYSLLNRFDGGFRFDSYGSNPSSGLLISTNPPPPPVITPEPGAARAAFDVLIYGERPCVFDDGLLSAQLTLVSTTFPSISVFSGLAAVGYVVPCRTARMSTAVVDAFQLLAEVSVVVAQGYAQAAANLAVVTSDQQMLAAIDVHLDQNPVRTSALTINVA